MKEKILVAIIVFGLLTSLYNISVKSQTISADNKKNSKPNLLFIYADQYRRQAMGFWSKPEYQGALNGVSDPVETPNLDKLANEGIVFTQAMSTQPVCSPFRGMLMSGMFPEQNGIMQNCKNGRKDELKQDAICLTDVFHNQGYSNAYFGKAHWHKTEPLFDINGNYVGSEDDPGGNYVNSFDTYVPPGNSRHSIEYWYQALKDSHKDPHIYSNDSVAINGKTDGELHRPKIYSPLNEADHIINYINNNRGQRDTQKPFSIIWALNPPHSPYSSIDDCDEDAYNEYYKDESIESLLNRPNVTTDLVDDKVRYYFANVTGVDKYIGRVISALELAGLKENTIIVFTSDHGEMMGSHERTGKTVEYEESFGVPFLISAPKQFEHRIENLLLGSTDIMPTLLGLMGMKDDIPNSVMGVDYSNLLVDENNLSVTKPKSALYLTKSKARGIRTDRYTFTLSNDGLVNSLFDNINDPYQLTSLNFDSLPNDEQTFLLSELGSWLAKANDNWYQEQKFAEFIIYPEETHIEGNTNPVNREDLHFNHPNPFAVATNIHVLVNKSSYVEVSVLDIKGQMVKSLFMGELAQGQHSFTWDASNMNLRKVNSGIYLYKIQINNTLFSEKMLLIN